MTDHAIPTGEAPAGQRKRVLVAGLGNPILGDDGVGWRVAQEVQRRLPELGPLAAAVEVGCYALGGLSLMEQMTGYKRAIVIDALAQGTPPGTLNVLPLDSLPDHSAVHTSAAHDASLQTALRLGRQMGASLPQTVMVVGVEAAALYEFSEDLTPAVAAAVPRAVEVVLDLLRAAASVSEK